MNGFTTDVREAILSRMEAILQGVQSVRTVWRNRGPVPRLEAPAVILFDGGERRIQVVRQVDGVQMPPGIYQMKPQVAIVLPQRDTVQNLTLNGGQLPVGPVLSAYRALIVPAILEDTELIYLVSGGSGQQGNGQIAYDGCDTDMKSGEEIGAFGAFMIFMFSISYMLSPADLASPEAVAAAQAEISQIWN